MSQDFIEREIMIKEIFAAFSKPSKPDWIGKAVKMTNGLNMTEMVDACGEVEKGEWPGNLGAAILKIALTKRRHEEERKSTQYKSDEPFSGHGGARSRYLKLLQKSIILCRVKAEMSYYQFWEMVNKPWTDTCDRTLVGDKTGYLKPEQEKELSKVMDVAWSVFGEITAPFQSENEAMAMAME